MPKKWKAPTVPEVQHSIRFSLEQWRHLHKKGGTDPFYSDGSNMNIVREQIIHAQVHLRELCKTEKVRRCPIEARLKPPKLVSRDYCAPRSKSGKCRELRAAAKKSRRAR
jgi:hypothetical protein